MRRRRFLVSAVVLGGTGLGILLVHPLRRRESVLLDIEALLGSDDRWVGIGRDYLSRAPAENDVETLGERLVAGLGWGVLLRSDVASVLGERARDDFRNGRVVALRGWVLSVTEARLCALKALAGR